MIEHKGIKKHVPYVQNLNILKYKNLKLTGDNSEFEWNQSKAKEKNVTWIDTSLKRYGKNKENTFIFL